MFRPSEDDFVCAGVHSDEPMLKPDHKAKKHGRPKPGRAIKKPRRGEKLGGGFFVFRRGEHGRVTPNGMPFEHPDDGAALAEAARLSVEVGGDFEVYGRIGATGGSNANA
jgi:hypothetical protein